ncbi:hypothetical protein KY317_01880 [Candidatus Woesearchaeota archaeon]|nr:hypothetical protein [Candidatus Woesearchaeota archaeon]
MRYLLLIAILVSGLVLAGCAQTGTDAVTGTAIKPLSEQAEEPAEDVCFDSDNGINERTAGTVTGISNGQEFEFSDTCIRGHHLIEYYCEENTYQNQNFVCQCMEGACHD